MRVAIQFTETEESKALPIILRRSAGMILRDRIYILSNDVVEEPQAGEIHFRTIARLPDTPPNLDDLHGRIL